MSDKPKGKGPMKKKVIIKKPAKTADEKKAEEDLREAAAGEAGPATPEKKKRFYKTTNPITGKTGFYYTKNPTQLLLKKGVSAKMVNQLPTEDAVAALLPPELRENIFSYHEPRSRIFHEKLKLLQKTNFYNSNEFNAFQELHADREFLSTQVNGAWDWWMDGQYENLDDLNGIKYIMKDTMRGPRNVRILNSDQYEGAKSYQEITRENDEIRRMEEELQERVDSADYEDRYNTLIAQQNLGENFDDFIGEVSELGRERERYDGYWSMYGTRGMIPNEFIDSDELDEMKTDMFSEKLDDIGVEIEELINAKTVDVGETFNDRIDDYTDPKLIDVIDKYKAFQQMETQLQDGTADERLRNERQKFRDKLKGELEEMVGEGELTDELDMRLSELHNAINLRDQFENMREDYDTSSIMEFIFDGDNLGFADSNDFINEAEKNEIDKFDGLMTVKDYIKEENGYEDDSDVILPEEFNERMDVMVYDEEEYDNMISALDENTQDLDTAMRALENAVSSGQFNLDPADYDLDENNNLITREQAEEEGKKNSIIQSMMNKKTGLPPELIEKIIDFLPDVGNFNRDATLEEQMENYELTDREKEMIFAPFLDSSVDSPDSPRYTELQYTDDEDDLRTATETETEDD